MARITEVNERIDSRGRRSWEVGSNIEIKKSYLDGIIRICTLVGLFVGPICKVVRARPEWPAILVGKFDDKVASSEA